jgi:ribonucleoside-triphosphate reductase (formate)
MEVIKRSGEVVPFDKKKIRRAVDKAFQEVTGDVCHDKGVFVSVHLRAKKLGKDAPVSVETIQDIVEKVLMERRYYDVAKAYIRYRYDHELARAKRTDTELLDMVRGNNEYWATENSNKNSKWVTTQRDYMAGIVSTDIARRYIFPKDAVAAHDAGIIHIHDMDYAAQNTLTNCFSADTAFITSEGTKTFNDFYDGSPVVVRDKNGLWRDAIVHCFGKQILYTVTLQSGRSEQQIRCTRNHRWVLKDGRVTENLQVGDSLFLLPDVASSYVPETIEEIKAFCYGFVIGDGSDIPNNRGVRVRLCGHKKDDYAGYFEHCGYQISEVPNSDDVVATNKGEFSKQVFLDSQAWQMLSTKQKIALFHGYYAADGRCSRNMMHTSDKRSLELILALAPMAGYYIASVRHDIHDTNDKSDASLYTITFRKKNNNNNAWRVKKIQKSYNNNHTQNVWCVVEPVTHTFTLAAGIVTGNCGLINLEDVLQNGTVVNGVQIDKPHRLSTAMTIATQVVAAVASSQYGGCTISLAHLAPFVRLSHDRYFEKYKSWGFGDSQSEEFAQADTKKEVSDAIQTLSYQLNSLTTTNGQSPFVSICLYLGETEEYKPELAMLIEETLRQRIQGMKNKVGVYVTVAFPKLLYVLEEDNIHEDSPYWYLTELAAKCTAKRMVPDYISEKMMKQIKVDASGEGHCFPCMGCRSFLSVWDKDPNKYYGRMNLGVVTINLVDVALSSGKDEKKFWQLMKERTELCHKVQKVRIKRLESTKADVAPILWCDGAYARLKPEDTLYNLIHGGYCTASLGFAGLYECVKYMTGESHTSPEGKEFGLKVMRYLNSQCDAWTKQDNVQHSLYGSPIEATTYTFAKALHKRFGEVKDITDRNYITNSYHVPVFEKIDPFSKLALESEFQKLSTGGAISYTETSNLQGNIPAVLEVIKFIYDNIMYAELNTKSDYCQKCGYDGEIQLLFNEDKCRHYYKCPNCGNEDTSKMNIARRVCGYISTTVPNEGRLDEFAHRYVHLDDHAIGE